MQIFRSASSGYRSRFFVVILYLHMASIMDPSKVEAITKWPRPTTVTEESFEELKRRLVSAPILTLPSGRNVRAPIAGNEVEELNFWDQGQASSRIIGPFEILERLGERGYHYHPLHVASYPVDQIQPDMSLSEEPESILDRQERVMRNKVIPL
ncbi:hypothetical protein Tco_0889800 [Tanacetum coccineum]